VCAGVQKDTQRKQLLEADQDRSLAYGVSQATNKKWPWRTETRCSTPSYSMIATTALSGGLVAVTKHAAALVLAEGAPRNPAPVSAIEDLPSLRRLDEDVVHRVVVRAWQERQGRGEAAVRRDGRTNKHGTGRSVSERSRLELLVLVHRRESKRWAAPVIGNVLREELDPG
jgi:hypothetical protein